ncbi:hypothetical protein [Demequina capsici]|uniref:Uncharacterized protein n=1 Tax=Demequina capsici TaxID=3075620 RepID=A0AA96F8T1_9MICO|nr:hypothetical protein [Demequina sp. OYTSA14]WNM24116.1 hypothetical protein RN606_12210 [Demequina sp. OYTSA14]
MTQHLVIAGDALVVAATRIDGLAVDLGSADDRSVQIRDGLGTAAEVEPLRSAVDGFVSSWGIRREGLCESLSGLASAARRVDEGFDGAEQNLAQSATPVSRTVAPGHEAI